MKTTSGYKMHRETKRLLANYTDPHRRGEFKRFAIECEMAQQKAKFAPIKVDKR